MIQLEMIKNAVTGSYWPKRTEHFIGRKQYLKEIEFEYLNRKRQIIVLRSISGTGKSTLANEFGYRYKNQSINDNIVYWVKANPTREIKEMLHETKKNILLIFDNCENYQIIKDYVEMAGNFKILITTRNSNIFKYLNREDAKEIVLEPFDEEESSDFIMKNFDGRIKETEPKEILQLLEQPLNLKILPIVLVKLVALIILSLKPFQKIDKKFLWEFKRTNAKELRLTLLNEEIFDLLLEKNEKSWKVLKLSSFFQTDFIPFTIYTELFGLDLNELEEAVEGFRNYSIAELNNEKEINGIKIHLTLRHTIETFLIMKKFEEYKTLEKEILEKIERILNGHLKDNILSNKKFLIFFYQIINKLLSSEFQSDKTKEKIANDFVIYLSFSNLNIDKDVMRFQISLALFGANEFLYIGDILNNIGSVYKKLSRYEEALESYFKSLEIKRKIYGTDEHSSIAYTLTNIGEVYLNLEKYEECLIYFERTLAICKNTFKTDEHSLISNTINRIGEVYFKIGKYEHAFINFQKSLSLMKSIYQNENHLDISKCLNNIGDCFLKQSKHKEAIENYYRSLMIKRKIYGNDENVDIVATLTNISNCLTKLGKTEEALYFNDQLLAIKRKLKETDDAHNG